MSDADTTEATVVEPEPGPVKSVYRSVGKPFRSRSDAEMDAVGWTIFLGLLVLLLPLLPLLIVVWLVTKALDILAPVGD